MGGSIEITRQWALSILKRMNMVKRRGSSTAKPEIKNLNELKTKFHEKIDELVTKYKIPPQLIINFDHTGVQLLPVSRWTMAEKGCDKVNIVGLDDKWEITGVMAGALSGDVLPPQVIYKGKTDLFHAKYNFPDDWDITHTENHWANKDTSFR
ncbi:uncharacterized protein LOC134281989 [Saccostrea cucullata]|uniref:uncharacterized protein LOC134281989 n=1 Tax=Saccostrea cuccullata TaxID=36930 RepID=UPI002ED65020